jgi:4-alpha-glucanotransferase
MRVLQFEVGTPGFKIESIDRNCVCYTGTHDNDTVRGWFRGAGDDTRSEQEIIESRENTLKVTGGSEETIHLDLVRLAFNSRARLAVVPIQDLLGLGSSARLNTPGTTSNNWRWRVTEKQLSEEFCQSVANMVQETARF